MDARLCVLLDLPPLSLTLTLHKSHCMNLFVCVSPHLLSVPLHFTTFSFHISLLSSLPLSLSLSLPSLLSLSHSLSLSLSSVIVVITCSFLRLNLVSCLFSVASLTHMASPTRLITPANLSDHLLPPPTHLRLLWGAGKRLLRSHSETSRGEDNICLPEHRAH